MADRIPVMDVRFFVIAIIIQRATGGDLAEVLDKIGRLIRQRLRAFGARQGADGRGPALGHRALGLAPGLARLPLVLELWIYQPPLHDLGRHQDAVDYRGLQLLGAWMINKIVAIKV